jgi:hypothetical protein
MDAPKEFSKIIDRKKYDVKTATLIADDVYWDGHNVERSGRNCFLYRTPNGAYFTVTLSQWQGEKDTLIPITQEEAISLFEGSLTEHAVSYSEAFPDVKVTEA